MTSRRDLLARGAAVAGLLAGAGLWPAAARAAWPAGAFDAKAWTDALKTLGLSAPVESKDLSLTAPEIAENGAVVPVALSTSLPGVKRLIVLVEKNPTVLSGVFELSEALEPSIATRVKMAQSSLVYGVAQLADGRTLFAQKDVKVTLGGCGG